MPTYSYDRNPDGSAVEVCTYERLEAGCYAQLRACPGQGDTRLYGAGQTFWDDTLQDDISYDHALQRARQIGTCFPESWYPWRYTGPLPYPPIQDEPDPGEPPGHVPPVPPITTPGQPSPPPPTPPPTGVPPPPLPTPPPPVIVVPPPDLSGVERAIADLNTRLNTLGQFISDSDEAILRRIGQAVTDMGAALTSTEMDIMLGIIQETGRLGGKILESEARIIASAVAEAQRLGRQLTDVERNVLAQIIAGTSDVLDEIDEATADVLGSIEYQANRVSTAVDAARDYVISRIESTLDGIRGAITSAQSDIKAAIETQTGQLRGEIDGAEREVLGAIQGVIATLEPTITEGLTAQSERIRELAEQVAANALSPEGLFAALWRSFSAQWRLMIDPISEITGAALPPAIAALMEFLEKEQAPSVAALLDTLAAVPNLPRELRGPIDAMRGGSAPIQMIGLVALAAALTIGAANALFANKLTEIEQVGNAATRATVPSLDAMLTLATKRVPSPENIFEVAAKWGYRDEWVQPLLDGTTQRLPVTQVLDLWLRGEWDATQVATELSQQGWTEERIAALRSLALVSPTPQDVVTFLFKDVLNPEVVRTFDLDAEFEESYDEALFRRAGVSKELARLYYRSGWTLPSPTQGFEMFQRTTPQSSDPAAPTYSDGDLSWQTVIGQPTLDQLLKTADVLPFWREKLTQIAYLPLTRVDVRRMHQMGVLSGPEVTRAYMDLGYDLTNARRLRAFTELLNTKEAKDETNVFRGPLRTRIVTLYTNRSINADEARAAFETIGYDAVESALFLAEGDLIRQADLNGEVTAALRNAYVRGFYSNERARQVLGQRGYNGTEQDELFLRWDIERETRELTETEAKLRDLTQAQVISAYREGLYTPDQALVSLFDLGFDEGEAATLLSLADVAEAKESRTAEEAAVKALYVAGQATRAQTQTSLDRIGLPVKHRDALIARWDAERDAKRTVIPLSALEAMVGRALISNSDAVSDLRARGYSVRDTDRLLALWGDKTAQRKLADAERARAAQERAAAAAQRAADRAARLANRRDLTPTQILDAWTQNVITRVQARAQLTALGLSGEEADQLLTTTFVEAARADEPPLPR